MLKYSVIIPCFNVASFIENTLFNLLTIIKDRCDVEIICIDDGSTDKTIEILKIFSEKNSVIQFYSKKNGGVSSARNYGLNKSLGEYIMFLDADDCYVNNPFSLIDASYGSEFIFFDYKKEISDLKEDKIYRSSEGYCLKGQLDDASMLEGIFNKKIAINICAIALKRTVVFDNMIFFNEEAHHCEDLDFLFRAIMVSTSFKYINSIVFKYQFRDGSAVNSVVNYYQVNKLHLFEELRSEIAIRYSATILKAFDFYVATVYFLLMISILKNKIETIDLLKKFIAAGNIIFNRKMYFPFNKIGFIVLVYKMLFRVTPFGFKFKMMKLIAMK